MSAVGKLVRAWVLVKTKNPNRTGNEIAKRFPNGGDAYVIVRVDQVEGGDNNLVVPVDAASEDDLNKVLWLIEGATGVEKLTALKFNKHWPKPPHPAA